MNFGMLKNMVENLVSSYICPFCSSKNMNEQHIDIVGAAGNTVNIDMHCPSCNRHFMAKTEVIQMELGTLTADKVSQIQRSLLALKGKLGGNLEIEIEKNTEAHTNIQTLIREEEILSLRKDMQQKEFSVADLFTDEGNND